MAVISPLKTTIHCMKRVIAYFFWGWVKRRKNIIGLLRKFLAILRGRGHRGGYENLKIYAPLYSLSNGGYLELKNLYGTVP